jgi:glycosyltransferase involved in cell wall biosynthesis
LSDKVSIIVPTRNRRDWLRQALRSVSDQTWPDKELVIVDGGGAISAEMVATAAVPSRA